MDMLHHGAAVEVIAPARSEMKVRSANILSLRAVPTLPGTR